jgi:hypothetical protein
MTASKSKSRCPAPDEHPGHSCKCRLCAVATIDTGVTMARHNVTPVEGYVPDAETAVEIALAVLGAVYGKEKIASEKPFRAVLHGDIWTVEGSLRPGWLGGVALAEISKTDATVLRVSHGR